MNPVLVNEKALAEFKKHYTEGDPDACWNWNGDSGGRYGRFKLDKVWYSAHRFSYTYHKGEIPFGILIRHTCDNQRCVNPNHLKPGTHKDNARDRDNRNRHGNKPSILNRLRAEYRYRNQPDQ